MEEEKFIVKKVKIKKLFDKDLKPGDYIEYDGKIYEFDGYDYGTYPICKDIETGEQVQLPHY